MDSHRGPKALKSSTKRPRSSRAVCCQSDCGRERSACIDMPPVLGMWMNIIFRMTATASCARARVPRLRPRPRPPVPRALPGPVRFAEGLRGSRHTARLCASRTSSLAAGCCSSNLRPRWSAGSTQCSHACSCRFASAVSYETREPCAHEFVWMIRCESITPKEASSRGLTLLMIASSLLDSFIITPS